MRRNIKAGGKGKEYFVTAETTNTYKKNNILFKQSPKRHLPLPKSISFAFTVFPVKSEDITEGELF